MKNIRIVANHLAECREAFTKFALAKNIKNLHSGEFRLDRKDFSLIPYPGLPTVYVAYSDDGRALFAGCSYNSTGHNAYFKITPDGRGTVRNDWAEGNPDFLEFYCLSEEPVENGMEPFRSWMYELRAIFNGIKMKGMDKPKYGSVAGLARSVSMEDIYRHLPWWRGSSKAADFEFWKNALANESLIPVADTEGYYLRVVTQTLDANLPTIIIRMVIKHMDDPTVHIPLEDTKDISFLSRLPVFVDSGELEPTGLVVNIITQLLDMDISSDE